VVWTHSPIQLRGMKSPLRRHYFIIL